MKKRVFSEDLHFKTVLKGKSAFGFTMVEVIVALAVVNTSLLAVFGVLQACSRASYHSRMLTKSVLLAERLLTERTLKQQLSFETTKGNEERFVWQVQVAPTNVECLGAVCVQVKWKEQNRPQEWELFSLIHIPPLIEGK